MKTAYEVLQVIQGHPIFLDEHIKRLEVSAQQLDYGVSSLANKIQEKVREICLEQDEDVYNVRIEYDGKNVQVQAVEGKYPTVKMQNEGVFCVLLEGKRVEPHQKVIRQDHQRYVREFLEKMDAFEGIYCDDHKIFEGSRSNLFYVKNKQLLTPKLTDVLPGITRMKVIELARELGMEVIEKDVHLSELGSADAAMLTGTSIHILPIAQINEMTFDVKDPLMRELMHSFETCIDREIEGGRV